MTNPTPQTGTAEKAAGRKPITFHKVIRDTDTARHGLCGAVIPKARAIGAKTTNGVDRVYCQHCASLEILDKQFNKEMSQELHVLKRYEAMLDALRWLQDQEEQS